MPSKSGRKGDNGHTVPDPVNPPDKREVKANYDELGRGAL